MFETNNWMKSFVAILGSTLIGLMLATGAAAENPEPVTVEVTFVDPITITEVNALQYGLLDQLLDADETVVIAPDSSVFDSNGRVVGGTQAAADLTVTATESTTITILVDNIVNGTGYTLATFICDYNAGPDTACDGAGFDVASIASATLRVGVTLTGNGSAVAGVANGRFDVTVSYQ